jgi:hypothetical protein
MEGSASNKTSVITWKLPLLCVRVSYVAERVSNIARLGGIRGFDAITDDCSTFPQSRMIAVCYVHVWREWWKVVKRC